MLKKIAALGGAGVMLLGAAFPVFASENHGGWSMPKGGMEIAIVGNNSADATANTGLNSQGNYQDNEAKAEDDSSATVNGGSGGRDMTTGDATATATAAVIANSTVNCGCDNNKKNKKMIKFAYVDTNYASATANSGLNMQDNDQKNKADAEDHSSATVDGGSGARTLTTGNAMSTSKAFTILNTNWSL